MLDCADLFRVPLTRDIAMEKYPEARPRIISDNGPQFIAKDFKEFIRISGRTHVPEPLNREPSAAGRRSVDQYSGARNIELGEPKRWGVRHVILKAGRTPSDLRVAQNQTTLRIQSLGSAVSRAVRGARRLCLENL